MAAIWIKSQHARKMLGDPASIKATKYDWPLSQWLYNSIIGFNNKLIKNYEFSIEIFHCYPLHLQGLFLVILFMSVMLMRSSKVTAACHGSIRVSSSFQYHICQSSTMWIRRRNTTNSFCYRALLSTWKSRLFHPAVRGLLYQKASKNLITKLKSRLSVIEETIYLLLSLTISIAVEIKNTSVLKTFLETIPSRER